MTISKKYFNAPITEAIIDLKITLPFQDGIEALDIHTDENVIFYPKKENVVGIHGMMQYGPAGDKAEVNRKLEGWKYVSADKKQIIQSRTTGFTFSRLSPYLGWDSFRDEAKKAWEIYKNRITIISFDRIAVRYINRIDIPATSIDLKDYLRTSPEISSDLPQNLDGYFLQLQLPFPELSARCLINQTIIDPINEHSISLVLDIDLFRTENVPQNEDDLWNYLEVLHVAKNQIFEACITDNTRKLFNQ